jgi:hypothetical protein
LLSSAAGRLVVSDAAGLRINAFAAGRLVDDDEILDEFRLLSSAAGRLVDGDAAGFRFNASAAGR